MLTYQQIFQQLLLVIHTMLFAFAIVKVIKEDFNIIRFGSINMNELHKQGQWITLLLIGLWLTGVALLVINNQTIETIMANPKLTAKILSVTLLTINGLALHFWLFPSLTKHSANPRKLAWIASIFGSISTTTWLFASFVGLSRVVAKGMTLNIYLALYCMALTAALLVAIFMVKPRISRAIRSISFQIH